MAFLTCIECGRDTISKYNESSLLVDLEKGTCKCFNCIVAENKHQMGFRNYLFRTSRDGAEKRHHEFRLTQSEFDEIIQFYELLCPHYLSQLDLVLLFYFH